jgi:hypothetical protein
LPFSLFILSFIFSSAQSLEVIVIGFDELSGWGVHQTPTSIFINARAKELPH